MIIVECLDVIATGVNLLLFRQQQSWRTHLHCIVLQLDLFEDLLLEWKYLVSDKTEWFVEPLVGDVVRREPRNESQLRAHDIPLGVGVTLQLPLLAALVFDQRVGISKPSAGPAFQAPSSCSSSPPMSKCGTSAIALTTPSCFPMETMPSRAMARSILFSSATSSTLSSFISSGWNVR